MAVTTLPQLAKEYKNYYKTKKDVLNNAKVFYKIQENASNKMSFIYEYLWKLHHFMW